MLGFPLPKTRPKWLVNPTTRRCLELDMYSAEHKLAFEYDGAQHDVYTPHFHASPHHFEYRRLLDRLKTELCREAGVLLVRIPWSAVSASDEVRTARFLERLLHTHGIPFRAILSPPSASVDSRQSIPIAEISGSTGVPRLGPREEEEVPPPSDEAQHPRALKKQLETVWHKNTHGSAGPRPARRAAMPVMAKGAAAPAAKDHAVSVRFV